MAAGNAADGIGHAEHGEAGGEGDADPADADLGDAGGHHGRAEYGGDQPEGADELGSKLTNHSDCPQKIPTRRRLDAAEIRENPPAGLMHRRLAGVLRGGGGPQRRPDSFNRPLALAS
jgi:hypothetical protein